MTAVGELLVLCPTVISSKRSNACLFWDLMPPVSIPHAVIVAFDVWSVLKTLSLSLLIDSRQQSFESLLLRRKWWTKNATHFKEPQIHGCTSRPIPCYSVYHLQAHNELPKMVWSGRLVITKLMHYWLKMQSKMVSTWRTVCGCGFQLKEFCGKCILCQQPDIVVWGMGVWIYIFHNHRLCHSFQFARDLIVLAKTVERAKRAVGP